VAGDSSDVANLSSWKTFKKSPSQSKTKSFNCFS